MINSNVSIECELKFSVSDFYGKFCNQLRNLALEEDADEITEIKISNQDGFSFRILPSGNVYYVTGISSSTLLLVLDIAIYSQQEVSKERIFKIVYAINTCVNKVFEPTLYINSSNIELRDYLQLEFSLERNCKAYQF